jgi:hypothetical protein
MFVDSEFTCEKRVHLIDRVGDQQLEVARATMKEEPLGTETQFPVGLHNAFFFAAFNALSYQVVLSSPMVLYAV